MFQDRPSQQVQNCPSQQRTGPAVQVAIDKTYKRRIAAVDWRIINKSTRIYRRRQRVTAVQVNKVLFLISLLSLSPPPPQTERGLWQQPWEIFVWRTGKGDPNGGPLNDPAPRLRALRKERTGNTHERTKPKPHRKMLIEAKDEDGRHHQHPKAPLVTLTEETKHTVS